MRPRCTKFMLPMGKMPDLSPFVRICQMNNYPASSMPTKLRYLDGQTRCGYVIPSESLRRYSVASYLPLDAAGQLGLHREDAVVVEGQGHVQLEAGRGGRDVLHHELADELVAVGHQPLALVHLDDEVSARNDVTKMSK